MKNINCHSEIRKKCTRIVHYSAQTDNGPSVIDFHYPEHYLKKISNFKRNLLNKIAVLKNFTNLKMPKYLRSHENCLVKSLFLVKLFAGIVNRRMNF